MKFEDEIYVVKTVVIPAGTDEFNGYVNNYNIGDLIDKLNEKKIGIIPEYSEQSIEYKVFGETKKAVVPLQSYFSNNVNVIGYNLRDENLEIILEDYCEKGSRNGRLGGPVHIKFGVYCSVKLEGSYEEGKKIGIIKNTVKDFYK